MSLNHVNTTNQLPDECGCPACQGLPETQRVVVIPDLLTADLPALLAERTAKGIQTYGHPLTTWNGRDACQDATEELLDGLAYVRQAQEERRDLAAAVVRLGQRLNRLRRLERDAEHYCGCQVCVAVRQGVPDGE